MTNKLLNIIKGSYPLKEIDPGEFAKMKVGGMNFEIKAYKAEGLGHVSVMRAKGFLGLMKMDTLIVNPKELDLPLYSYDRIFAMGNDMLITELYDTTVTLFPDRELMRVKADYDAIPERDPGEHWYDDLRLRCSISKRGGKKQTPILDELTAKHFEAYLGANPLPVTDHHKKHSFTWVYVNGLLTNGGPSTDVFKKHIGEAKTKELFENILFGTK